MEAGRNIGGTDYSFGRPRTLNFVPKTDQEKHFWPIALRIESIARWKKAKVDHLCSTSDTTQGKAGSNSSHGPPKNKPVWSFSN